MSEPPPPQPCPTFNALLPRAPYILALITLVGGLFLATMRDARRDENLYLMETAIMADCLRSGQWFGNEAVGVHGFLFKIPAAVLFLVFGKSVYAATAVNVVISAVTILVACGVFRRILKSDWWAFVATLMLLVNFQFVKLTPSYTRDIPSMLCLLLVADAIARRRHHWWIGLLLVLLLDAKEYAFFLVLPAYGLWILIDEWDRRRDGQITGMARRVLARGTAAVLPAIVYLVLMFCTSLVPLNMFAANALGLGAGGFDNHAFDRFNVGAATRNAWRRGGEIVKLEEEKRRIDERKRKQQKTAPDDHDWTAGPTIDRTKKDGPIVVLARYFGKLFYPNLFSLDGIPKAVALPALVMSIGLFRRRREDGAEWAPICMITWIFVLFLIFVASLPRYMIPVFPFLIMLYTQFLREGLTRGRWTALVIAAATAYGIAGIFHHSGGHVHRLMFNVLLGLATAAAAIAATRRWRGSLLATACIVAIVCGTSATAMTRYALHHRKAQVWNHKTFGYNVELERILQEFGPDDRFWLHDVEWRELLHFYTGQRPATPEWRGPLKDWIPKKHLLHRYGEHRAFNFWWKDDGKDFRNRLNAHRIDRVALVVSRVKKRKFFPYQEYLWWFKQEPWLQFEKQVPLKNKSLYLFRYTGRDAEILLDRDTESDQAPGE
jgi:hypothetical protein